MRKRGRTFTRRIDPLAALRSAGRQHPLDADQKLRLGVHLRVHLQALATGQADAVAFHNLANGVNVSKVLAERGTGAEFDEQVGGAQQALRQLKHNGNRGRWLLDGPNLNALKAWLDVYDAQLEVVSQQEAMDALDEVQRRLARGQIFEDVREAA
jgi:hypothetical protein